MKGVPSMPFISSIILAILASGIIILSNDQVIRGKGSKLPLPRCKVDKDCLPVCGVCKFCLCYNTLCVRRCKADQKLKWEVPH